MADISGIAGKQISETREALQKKQTEQKDMAGMVESESTNLNRPDSVELSSQVTDALKTETGFDANKVEKIKQALAEGEYPINAQRIAKEMYDLEKLL